MKKKVLLIDDSVTIHRVIDLSIDFDKFEIVKVFSSEDASIKINEDRYDHILLDNKLEGVNVPEYITEIKAVQRDCKIILLVGAFDRFTEDDLANSGADDFLVKPFDSQSLDTKLNGEPLIEGREADVYGGEPEQNPNTFIPVPEDDADGDIMKTDFIERMPEADKNREHTVEESIAPEPLTGSIPEEIIPLAPVPAGDDYLKTLDDIHEDSDSQDDPFGDLKEANDFDEEDEEQNLPKVEEKLPEPVAVIEEPLAVIEEPLAAIEEPLTVIEEPLVVIEEPLTAVEEPLVAVEENLLPEVEPEPEAIVEDEMPSLADFLDNVAAEEIASEPVLEEETLEDVLDVASVELPEEVAEEPVQVPVFEPVIEPVIAPVEVEAPVQVQAPVEVETPVRVPAPVAGGITISISREEIVAMIGQAIDKRVLEEVLRDVLAKNMEEIVRSIVPAMAEKYIKAEIERLKNDE